MIIESMVREAKKTHRKMLEGKDTPWIIETLHKASDHHYNVGILMMALEMLNPRLQLTDTYSSIECCKISVPCPTLGEWCTVHINEIETCDIKTLLRNVQINASSDEVKERILGHIANYYVGGMARIAMRDMDKGKSLEQCKKEVKESLANLGHTCRDMEQVIRQIGDDFRAMTAFGLGLYRV